MQMNTDTYRAMNTEKARVIAAMQMGKGLETEWIENLPWIEAAAKNWELLCNGQPTYVMDAPRPTDGATSEELINQGFVGVYQKR
jgi:hypothetical protein